MHTDKSRSKLPQLTYFCKQKWADDSTSNANTNETDPAALRRLRGCPGSWSAETSHQGSPRWRQQILCFRGIDGWTGRMMQIEMIRSNANMEGILKCWFAARVVTIGGLSAHWAKILQSQKHPIWKTDAADAGNGAIWKTPHKKKKKRKTRSNPHLSLIRDGGTQHELLADRLDPEGLGVVLTL